MLISFWCAIRRTKVHRNWKPNTYPTKEYLNSQIYSGQAPVALFAKIKRHPDEVTAWNLRVKPNSLLSCSEQCSIRSCRLAELLRVHNHWATNMARSIHSLLLSWRFILKRVHFYVSQAKKACWTWNVPWHLPLGTGHLWCLNLRLMYLPLRLSCRERELCCCLWKEKKKTFGL